MINRILSQHIENTKKSILLLGPRQVGKSTLINSLKPDLTLNLAHQETFLEFVSDPSALEKKIETTGAKTIFIDEIQRVSSLLNTIQTIVDDKKGHRFYLTGSSARKLKRGRANLLPGRVLSYQLGPFTSAEFNYEMDTQKILQFGTLPEAYLSSKDAFTKKLLMSYVGLYLNEEIKAEAVTRNLESFSRFLKAVLVQVAQFIDYSKLAKIAKISRHNCSRYFEVLEDTLIGYRIYPFEDCLETADLIKHPKFYFFDLGVYNGMVGNFEASVDRVGMLSEQLVFSQIINSAKAFDKEISVSTFRTRSNLEIDFILKIDKKIYAIEVKHSDNLHSDDVRPLKGFANYFPKKYTPYIFHMGKEKRKIDGVWCLPWQQGLKEIGL